MRLAALAASVLLALGAVQAVAQPQIPSTFFGSASIEGKTPPPDSNVRAFIAGLDCTQDPDSSHFVIEGGVGAYVVSVMHDSQKAGCGRDDKAVVFKINGLEAAQKGVWKPGPQQLDLNAGRGTPQPLPTATPTPEGTVRPPSPTPSPVVTIVRPTGTPPIDPITITPQQLGGSGGKGGGGRVLPPGESTADGGVPIWLLAGIVLGGVLAFGAAVGFFLSRKLTADRP